MQNVDMEHEQLANDVDDGHQQNAVDAQDDRVSYGTEVVEVVVRFERGGDGGTVGETPHEEVDAYTWRSDA